MKTLASGLLVASALVCLTSVSFGATGVKISQVYGGGGGTGAATYNVDYVEIFNSSSIAVNIGGWTVEYGSATGNWGSSATNIFTFPAGTTIQPCTYMLTSQGTAGTGGGPLPIPADFFGTLTISATNGKIGLFKSVNTNLACGSEVAGTLIDKVAFGTANCAEGTAVAALSITTGAVRNGGGTVDSDNNVADFTVTTAPVPHNSLSARNPACTTSPALPSTWGAVKSLYR